MAKKYQEVYEEHFVSADQSCLATAQLSVHMVTMDMVSCYLFPWFETTARKRLSRHISSHLQPSLPDFLPHWLSYAVGSCQYAIVTIHYVTGLAPYTCPGCCLWILCFSLT